MALWPSALRFPGAGLTSRADIGVMGVIVR